MPSFPFFSQSNTMDCGPACLFMIAKYYGNTIDISQLRDYSGFSRQGVTLLGVSDAAEKIGFRTRGVTLTLDQLVNECSLPAVLHWRRNHFIVLPPQKFKKNYLYVADPANSSLIKIQTEDFRRNWEQFEDESTGIALLMEPTAKFYEVKSMKVNRMGWQLLWQYARDYKKYFVQIFIGLALGSVLQLFLPFLTQQVVDRGIVPKNTRFVYVILIAQFALFLGRIMLEFVRNSILLFISTRINLFILSDFWIKLMKLPISFFETRRPGDILQRINDHHRIEQFVTGTVLNTIFSIFSLLIFSVIILTYNVRIFLIFTVGSVLYFLWIKLFLRYRRELNYRNFSLAAQENNITMQLINGMREIKLNNAETIKRWEWENLRVSSFRLGFKSLSLNQYQQAGSFLINEGKNILITFLTAEEVISGHLTIGTMLAIQYIIGQLNSPVEQLIGFAQSSQDAKISLERLNEIHLLDNEEKGDSSILISTEILKDKNKSISLSNVSFTYPGPENSPVLKNLNLHIPEGKITAIVGTSGSGKTTVLKLLLRFYENYLGEISTGDVPLNRISHSQWRSTCGAVLQDGYVFNDSIKKNIAVGEEYPEEHKLIHACQVANILSYISSLPQGLNTTIGDEGNGISQGQRQRILIARSVYKDPQFIFFDEATSSLDADNELVIINNLNEFFKEKTVVIVAHRLSTVKNAHNIVVLDEGTIVEEGTHEELILRKGKYYELVKNQLELTK